MIEMSSTILTVFKKELKDLFRDRRTIIMTLLIPLVLMPIMFNLIGKGISGSKDTVQSNVKIAIVDNTNSSLQKYIKAEKNINVIKSKNINEDIKSGKIYLAIDIPKNFDSNIGKDSTSSIKITYDNSSQDSSTADEIVKSMIDSYSKVIVNERLKEKNIDLNILNPVQVNTATVVKEDTGVAQMVLSVILPIYLIMYSVSGPISAATDLGVGEKERGTIEPLLTTKAGRLSLLWGKFLAITVLGVMTSAASLIGIFIGIKENSSTFGNINGMNINILALIIIGVLIILLTMSFGALELSISIFAKSSKEAATYMSPLIIVAMLPIYAVYTLDAKNIGIMYFNIPIVNVVCIIKEVISGIYNYSHIGITTIWIVVYAVVCVLVARFMFSREEVIFRS